MSKKEIIKKELTNFINKLIKNNPILTPYEINNGLCSEVADHLASTLELNFCSILNIEYNEKEKEKMLATTSNNANKNQIYLAIIKVNHDWVYDLESKLHFDAEIPDGVIHIDDIPLFSRVIARLKIKEDIDFGGKWTKEYSEQILKEEKDLK